MSQNKKAKSRRTISRREFLRSTIGVGAAASAGLLLSACQGAPAAPAAVEAGPTPTLPPAPTAAVAKEAEAPAPAEEGVTSGGTIVWMGHQEVAGLSPDDGGPTVQWVMITNIHNAMLELDENIVLQPILAESFEAAEDGLQYTFHLRQGIKFHDDTEMTSQDVKYSFDYYRNPDNAASIVNNFLGIDTVETPDDYTVVINMSEPNAAFLINAATLFIVPEHYHSDIGEDAYRSAPIGTGAFKLKEFSPAESTLLEAFDDHFRGRPKVDFLREDVVPEASVRAIALETGDADSAVWPLLVDDNIRFAADPNFTTFRTATRAVNHFPLNNSLPQLSDKRVRQAMLMAIDRQQVIDDIFSGAATVADTNLSPSLALWHNPNTKKYEYDPEGAKALLDEAGWTAGGDGIREKDGVRLSFTCTVITGDQARRPEAEVVQQYLKEVGIEMMIEEAPVASILEGMRSGTMEASLYNWTYGSIDPDASTTLRSDGGNNFSQFKNERVDELLDMGLVEVNTEKRQAIYNEIQEIVAEEVPFLYMMYWDWFNIFTGRIKGLPDSALSGDEIYRKAYEWWIEEA